MKQILFLLLLTVAAACGFTVNGTTYTTTGSSADVQAAVSAASDGSTVIIPNGSYSWSSLVNVSKYLILKAATFGSVNITHANGANYLISINSSSAGHTELAGINFLPGSATGGYLDIDGNGQIVLLHDCSFNIPNFQLNKVISWNMAGGVVYNCRFFSTDVNGTSGSDGSGSGCLVVKSPKPWNDASTFGTLDSTGTNNLYIEDCVFTNIYNQAIDVDDNGRVVLRHSVLNNTQMLTHGTTSLYGGRQIELYNNAYHYVVQPRNGSGMTTVNLNRWLWMRAGTAVVTDNSFDPIQSSDWGTKPCLVFIDESLTRPGSGAGCETTYPGTHWPGQGADGTRQISDPIHIWNNTGTVNVGTNDQDDQCGHGLSTANFFKINRDYFMTARDGYVKYPYPHPARSGGTAAPAPTPTPFAPLNLHST